MKTLKTLFTTLLFLGAIQMLSAQQRNCGTMEHLHNLQQQDLQLSQRMNEIEQFTRQWIASHPNGDGSRALYNIPVVVHVVYNTSAQNVSDAQVQSQIAVLNKDYSKTNTDASGIPSVWQSIAATTDIQFCLATVDPNGNATTGIVRKSTTVTSFNTNDAVKSSTSGGDNAWNATKYLNLWVCHLSGGVLGYAQFPGGPASTDGVVIDYQAFGTTGTAAAPFNLGRTATHEIGHWFNLYHIWGDDGGACTGSDNVSDTPNQGSENYGCPAFPHISCSNGPNGDMWMNYMDYTDDNCMFMFSNGQKARMQALFASGGARYSILSSNGCGTPPPPPACGTPGSLSATSVTTSSATLNWGAVSGATYNVRIKATSSSTWTNGTSTSTSLGISNLTAGTQYEFQVQAVCSAGAGNFSASAFFTTTSAGCSDVYEPNNSRSAAKAIPVNVAVTGLLTSTSDIDWFYFSNSSTQKNIKVTLTNLPYDYDLYLYKSSGSLLAYSYNGGTTSETIKYNNAPVSTYYVRVIPYSGSSTTLCYTLTTQISATAFRESGEAELVVESEASHIRNLYPNPANDYFMVEFVSSNSAELNYNIIDVTGREISGGKEMTTIGENSFKIPTGALSTGIYLFRLNDGKENYTKRFVIER